MDRPISSCWASSRVSMGRESSGVTGMGGSEGWAQTEMNRARPTRTRMGTLRWLKMGMPANSASVRTKGHSSGFSHASSCASVKLIIASADDLRDGLQRALDVLDQGRHHPGPGDGQHGHGRDHLGHDPCTLR
eukprot:Opistho-2@71420